MSQPFRSPPTPGPTSTRGRRGSRPPSTRGSRGSDSGLPSTRSRRESATSSDGVGRSSLGSGGQISFLCSPLGARSRMLVLHPGGGEGLSSSLMSIPPLSFPGKNFSSPSQGINDPFFDEEVEALLLKGAVEVVPLDPPSLGYISRIFLVPMKSGGMRPILNLKKLNADHLDTPTFRMETVEDVRHALRPGVWATSIDLRDAYFHVKLQPDVRKFMRFGWRGRLFQFGALPFDLSPAPKEFTFLTKLIKAVRGAKGIRTIFYLDDILVLG